MKERNGREVGMKRESRRKGGTERRKENLMNKKSADGLLDLATREMFSKAIQLVTWTANDQGQHAIVCSGLVGICG